MKTRVLVTRPEPQASQWVGHLRAARIDAVPLSLIDILPPEHEPLVRDAWAALHHDEMAVFVSPNAVTHFFASMPHRAAWPDGVKAACTGPGTAAALRRQGLTDEQIVEPPGQSDQFDSETLWTSRLAGAEWREKSVLVVRGDGGRDWLADTLRQHGALVHYVQAYRRALPDMDVTSQHLLDQALESPRIHLWLFSSSQAVDHLTRLTPPGTPWAVARALATHPRIAEAARALGFGEVHETAPTEAAVATAIQRLDSASIESRAQ